MIDLTSRKFAISLLVISLGFILVILGKLSSDIWLALAVGEAGIYQYFNIKEKKIE